MIVLCKTHLTRQGDAETDRETVEESKEEVDHEQSLEAQGGRTDSSDGSKVFLGTSQTLHYGAFHPKGVPLPLSFPSYAAVSVDSGGLSRDFGGAVARLHYDLFWFETSGRGRMSRNGRAHQWSVSNSGVASTQIPPMLPRRRLRKKLTMAKAWGPKEATLHYGAFHPKGVPLPLSPRKRQCR
ncbi:hypothetical protein BDK51DRAFT_29670, partial [Blyttiomyces helicus]